ncbi:hypothetical protein D3C85_1075910 [compost metagenome]
MDVWKWATGEDLDVMRLIAVEQQSPHAAARYKLDDESLMIGRALYRSALITYAECVDSDTWPAYDAGEEEQTIGVPGWAIGQFEEELVVGGLEE